MPVSFANIPQDWKSPLFWIEVDPSQAGYPRNRQPALLVGQKFSLGSAVADVPIAVGTQAQAKALFGEGSMLERMFAAYFAKNRANEVWAMPVVEPVSGQAATGSVTITHAPTEAGTLYLYIAGQRVSVGIAADDTAAEIATALTAEISATPTLPVAAAVDGSNTAKVNLTCKWKGATGNDIDLTMNYRGVYGGEQLPTALTLALSSTKLTGGSGAPTFTAAIAALGEQPFEYVAMPFTDSTSTLAWATEYGFGDTGRWGWMRQLYGSIWSAKRDSYANLMNWGPTENYAVVSTMGIEPAAPTPVWEWAAVYAANAARGLSIDPARPIQTLRFDGCLPAPVHQRFSQLERNALGGVGIATQAAGADDVPFILRETTRYQVNSYGQGDDAYDLATTLSTLARLFRDMRHAITSKFPRHKLADDGTRFGPGQAIVTPKVIKAELIAQYRVQEFNGLVENMKAFKNALIVERASENPNRLNVLYPPDLINGLRVFAVLGQFRLQYDRGVDTATA